MIKIILYYKFCEIKHGDQFCDQHKAICAALDLKGRVYIAQEGINGTLAGTEKDIERYKKCLCAIQGFQKTEFKEDTSKTIPFNRLIVKTRPEIVTLKTRQNVDPTKKSVPHLSPQKWREVLESNEDYALIDVRNNYESTIGHFEGAILPDVENFFDFPQWLNSADIPKNKKVLMYCTGGIRCEKFSLFMKERGYKDIYQLNGGIINYGQKEGGAHFRGKCFVFDDRLSVSVNKKEKAPISRCKITRTPCDQYLNCANCECNKLFICSPEGARKLEGCCSKACQKAKKKRPFNPNKIYAPWRRFYHYQS